LFRLQIVAAGSTAVPARLFGTLISNDAVIGESLEGATDPTLKPASLGGALVAAVKDDLAAHLDDDAIYRHPLAIDKHKPDKIQLRSRSGSLFEPMVQPTVRRAESLGSTII
jgi:hypothetical protein